MVIEKLLLHILIILMPVFAYSAIFENKKYAGSPYLCGVLQSMSVTLCVIFSFYDHGIHWDLRFAPLVLAFLYGGPIAGTMVLAAHLGILIFINGDHIIFEYISALLVAAISIFSLKKFWSFEKTKRIRISVLIGIWPAVVMLVLLAVHYTVNDVSVSDLNDILLNIAVFGFIHILAIWFASILNESLIERDKMQQEMLRAEKLNTLGELAASVAHEIRNPLTVVKGFLQIMQKDDKNTDKNHPYLPLVLSELGRAEHIINDYLNFSKPQFKKLEEIRLYEVISEVCTLLQPFAVKAGIQIVRDLEKDFILHADRDQIKQALINIIKNSIEATDSGGSILISMTCSRNEANISIRDTGKGMSTEQLERIGTLFYTTKDKGTGLGTSVSRSIIEAMGGQLFYTSVLGQGTEASVFLPGEAIQPCDT
ncbi:ATP-binding protein [Peribacillus sp. SCS-155]|uniref:ATP-binding protein n=1 Tax=Peribacillus sedimenti TaxID=3115297 RepID=UPI0039066ED9